MKGDCGFVAVLWIVTSLVNWTISKALVEVPPLQVIT